MDNRTALTFFSDLAGNNPDQLDVKVSKDGKSDFSHLDAEFILKYADEKSDILDLGSGSGLTVNKIHTKIGKITAVEKFGSFSKFIVQAGNVEVVNCDLMDFSSPRRYDLITMFGIVQYFNESEVNRLYELYRGYLREAGRLLIKNQFGVSGDVNVSGFSEDLGKEYYSQYRHLDKEPETLNSLGFKNIRAYDVYPPECNHWPNTHYYAIEASL